MYMNGGWLGRSGAGTVYSNEELIGEDATMDNYWYHRGNSLVKMRIANSLEQVYCNGQSGVSSYQL